MNMCDIVLDCFSECSSYVISKRDSLKIEKERFTYPNKEVNKEKALERSDSDLQKLSNPQIPVKDLKSRKEENEGIADRSEDEKDHHRKSLEREKDRDMSRRHDNHRHIYVCTLNAFYLRLTGYDVDVYRYLEPLYNDNRKVWQKPSDGRFSLMYVDEFIEEFLTKDYSCDIVMPCLKKRWTLEHNGSLEPRKSILLTDKCSQCQSLSVLKDDFKEEE